MKTRQENSLKIKQEAKRLGFDSVGISKAQLLKKDAIELEKWLKEKHHGKMGYMENHFDKRVDPSKLVPGAKSVISLSYNYYTERKQSDPAAPKVAMYAFGEDYHFVVKERLQALFSFIQDNIGQVEGRFFVDSAPVLERALARESGIGWMAKNGMLISKTNGSYFFLAELIIDIDLEYDQPIDEHCGTCTKCIDACPTEAILPNGKLAAEKCISYATIELRDKELPESFNGKMRNWMFGCDICQDVCPWNRFSKPHQEKKFLPSEELLSKTQMEWEGLLKEEFNVLFNKSAIKRTRFEGLKRNINALKK